MTPGLVALFLAAQYRPHADETPVAKATRALFSPGEVEAFKAATGCTWVEAVDAVSRKRNAEKDPAQVRNRKAGSSPAWPWSPSTTDAF